MNSGKVLLIDGNSILNRAFYGLQGEQLLQTSQGVYTNAVFGFLNILNMYMEEENPEYICVAFDLKAPTLRHREFEQYKAHRKGMPDELAVQVPIIKEVLDAMNIKRLEFEGYEADDIIGSLAASASKKGLETVIVTGDRDALQLIDINTRVKIPSTSNGKTKTTIYDYNSIKEKYNLKPEEFIEVKGLMGDPSDNIPGVRGIGEKTALKLVTEFKTLENIYENIEKISSVSLKGKLTEGKNDAFLSRKLATIITNMDFADENIINKIKSSSLNKEELYKVFKKLEFNKFIEKYSLDEKSSMKVYSKQIKCMNNLTELKEIVKTIYSTGEMSIVFLSDRRDGYENPVGCAIAYSPEESVYIDFIDKIEVDDFLVHFKDVFQNGKIKKIGHNIKSLLIYLKKRDIIVEGLAFDTMIAAYLLDALKQSYDIDELIYKYLQMKTQSLSQLQGKGKNFTPFESINKNELSCITGIYAEAVFRLRDILLQELKRNDQEGLYFDIELPLVEILADMEFRGFCIDRNSLEKLSEKFNGQIDSLTKRIYFLAGEEFNINSPKQLGVILFEKLKLPTMKKTKTGYSTDVEVLEKLLGKHDIIDDLIYYRQLVKLKSTYIDGLMNVIDPVSGKVHSSFNQTVVVTGRISSTEPNLQNIPVKMESGREIRKAFIPSRPDFILSDADYSQIELRVLAHITGDENMIKAFEKGEDIHKGTAAQIFGVSVEAVTKEMRSAAKAVNFGIVYGIGDFSLSQDLGISKQEAKKYIEQYLDRYPGVRKYMKNIVEEGRKNGYVSTIFNRRRYVPELLSKNFNIRSFGERIALNTPIQGSAADIIKIAMVGVHHELKKRKMKSVLILQVHDELIVETHMDEINQVSSIMKECMEQVVKLKVKLIAEVSTGRNWYEAKGL